MTILYFLLSLGILIFIHELGHFLLAKRAGVCVEEFSLGFGPRLFGYKRGDTDYRISLLPFGGYVKMRGEEEGDAAATSDPQSYAQKSVAKRAKILVAGPLMNFILAAVLLPVVFMIGRHQPAFLDEQALIHTVRSHSPAKTAGLRAGDRITSIDGVVVSTWEDLINQTLVAPEKTVTITFVRGNEILEKQLVIGELPELRGGYLGVEPFLFAGNDAVIDQVKPHGPADRAGIKSGDHVLAVNGMPIADWFDLAEHVNEAKGKEVQLLIDRDGAHELVSVTPDFSKDYGRWLIGIQKDRSRGVPMVIKRYRPFEAVVAGMKECGKLMTLTGSVLWRLVTFQLSYKVLGGPIVIAKSTAAAAATGLTDFLYFIAFLSLQLSMLNLLPIPVLDGGHLFFLGLEAVMRRPVSQRIRGIANRIGFAILITLMLAVTANDIESLWGIGNLIRKIF